MRSKRAIAAVAAVLAVAAALLAPSAAQADSPTPKSEKFSAAQLQTVSAAVAEASPGGIAWAVDRASDRVTVVADATVTDAEIAEVTRSAGELAGAITVERTPGILKRFAEGGDAIYNDLGGRCSLGFNVRSGSTYYFITAGHCTEDPYGPTPPYPLWSFDAATVHGTTEDSNFPINDYGLVIYDPQPSSVPSSVNLYNGSSQTISSFGNASTGQDACRSGSTTGLQCGEITGLGYTVDYGGGDVVYDMIRTNICAEPGDSGGPLFSGSTGLGLTSGGSGNCSVGGTTYFQPIVEAVNDYGVSIP